MKMVISITCFVLAPLASSCVSDNEQIGATAAAQNTVDAVFESQISRSTKETHPIIIVQLTNVSSEPVCIPRSTVENPSSYEMHIELRKGKDLFPFIDSGMILPPLPGRVELQPGGKVRQYYFIEHRMMIKEDFMTTKRLSASIEFIYYRCNDPSFLRYRSGWRNI